jgi:hypothetical protein
MWSAQRIPMAINISTNKHVIFMTKSLCYSHFKNHDSPTTDWISLSLHSEFLKYCVQHLGGLPKQIHTVSGKEPKTLLKHLLWSY